MTCAMGHGLPDYWQDSIPIYRKHRVVGHLFASWGMSLNIRWSRRAGPCR